MSMHTSNFCQVMKLLAMLLLASFMVLGQSWADTKHLPLAKDGVHDPAGPAISYLQEPGEALAKLPPDVVGNQVRWVKALAEGAISPRTNILPETKVNILDLDVILPRTGEMPMVRFPHRQHTEWLDCSNCHEKLFKSKAGATKALNMFEILQGEYCGLCHGAVAFPLTECKRCHSVERK
jgi:c(7)-type cytochrome triheme protein